MAAGSYRERQERGVTWFRLDEKGAFHAKVLAAKNEAYGAWCRAGQWASEHLTDGFIPADTAHTIAPERIWNRLVSVGLMEPHDGPGGYGDGYQIHDFLDYNPPREKVLAERKRKADNITAYRRRRGLPVSNGVSGGVTGYEPDRNHGPDPDPDPREEDQREPPLVPPVGGKAKKGTRLPVGWTPSHEAFGVGFKLGLEAGDIEREQESFRDYWTAMPGQRGVKLDWDATFRNWLRKAAERKPRTAARVQVPAKDGQFRWDDPAHEVKS